MIKEIMKAFCNRFTYNIIMWNETNPTLASPLRNKHLKNRKNVNKTSSGRGFNVPLYTDLTRRISDSPKI